MEDLALLTKPRFAYTICIGFGDSKRFKDTDRSYPAKPGLNESDNVVDILPDQVWLPRQSRGWFAVPCEFPYAAPQCPYLLSLY